LLSRPFSVQSAQRFALVTAYPVHARLQWTTNSTSVRIRNEVRSIRSPTVGAFVGSKLFAQLAGGQLWAKLLNQTVLQDPEKWCNLTILLDIPMPEVKSLPGPSRTQLRTKRRRRHSMQMVPSC
jgi:hypothetical protein